jgi:ribosomal protein L16/L10AE
LGSVVHPGRILYEINGVSEVIARQALKNNLQNASKTKFNEIRKQIK